MSKIYITGVSGTGKSTLAEELTKRGVVSFDIDAVSELCHWRNRQTKQRAEYQYGIGKDWLEAHEWICDQHKLEELLAGQSGDVAVLGLASNQDDFLSMFEKVFLLRCKEETFLHRLSTRDGENQFAKDKSEQEHILSWYKEFEDSMLKSGAIAIDSEETIQQMADSIMMAIGH